MTRVLPPPPGLANQCSQDYLMTLMRFSSRKPPPESVMVCSFCEKNGEDPSFYGSHKLKDENNEICCPVIKKYTCPNCGVKGKHTASYCPFSQKQTKSPPVKHTPKRTSPPKATLRPRNTSPTDKQLTLRERYLRVLPILEQIELRIAVELRSMQLEQDLKRVCIQ